jgi:hypothetical protein
MNLRDLLSVPVHYGSFAYFCCCGLFECYEEAQARSSYTAFLG